MLRASEHPILCGELIKELERFHSIDGRDYLSFCKYYLSEALRIESLEVQ